MLFSDIESSTVSLRRLGVHWGDALTAHRRILRAVFEAHEGREMGTEGDSFFVVFGSAHQAVLAAVEGQRQLQANRWPEEVPLRVRIGIHTGEPDRHDDGYIGIDVHRAARIAATAHGGQIVLSEATRQLVSDLAASFSWRDLGWHRLKDLPEPEHLYDLVDPELLSAFPPLRSLGTLASLPAIGSPLVGRGSELAEIHDVLCDDDVCLVTLTGTGGSGKTRLALAVAGGLGEQFPSGVFFVRCHTADRGALMWAAMADAIGVTGDSTELPEDRTLRFLRDRQALLVLDNLEQISDADHVVSRLLNGAPSVKVLVTSRRPLHLVAEHEYPVLPLSLPADDLVDREDAVRTPAIELFVQRAQMAQPRFTLTQANTADVVGLCRRLDGLPLAIELAAARTRLLSPKGLLSRIDESLGTGVTASDRAERHRTVGKTIAWSHDLLTAEEQRVFRRLGVFSRSFDLPAVEAVVETGGTDALDLVARLIDVNLLEVTEDVEGEPRITMLQTIRSFARTQLKASGEREDVRRRHSQWCLQMATEICESLHGPTQVLALDRMSLVQQDIRAALSWCLRPSSEVGAERTELGFLLISQMNVFWHRFGYVAEGRGWQERAIAIADGEDSAGLVDALHGMAVLELQQNDVQSATKALETALGMASRLGDLDREAREANSLGVARRSVGDTAAARKLLERSISLAQRVGNAKRETTALTNMAVILLDSGEFESAVDASRQAIAADRARDDPWGMAINQTNLAMVLLRAEGPESAYTHLVSIAPASIALADPELAVATIEMLAATLAELGDAPRAAMLMGAADAERSRVGMPRSTPDQEYCDQSLDKGRPLITSAEWTACHTRGAELSIDQALAKALTRQPAVP